MTLSNSPDGLPPLRDVIAAHGLQAKKKLSQNFILDLNLTRRIARTAGPLEGRWVLEIGPGPGGLTRALLLEGASKVIAVERDHRCVPALDEISAHYPGRLNVHEGDAVDLDWRALLKDCPGKVIIAANLPYAIADPPLSGLDWYGSMAALVGPDGSHVSKGSGRADRRSSRVEGVWPARCSLAVAYRSASCHDIETFRVCAPAESRFRR